MNIISDIAGNYKTLLALLQKMPDEEVVSVGDMVDRGPRSKEVVEFFMKNGRAILGNHEHMMIDYAKKTSIYIDGIWFYNGGMATYNSFNQNIPDDVIDWVGKLPLYIETDDAFISHSFVYDWSKFGDALKLCHPNGRLNERSIIWNRHYPQSRDDGKTQIAGHNSQFGLETFLNPNEDVIACCIDDSSRKKLTGIHLPSFKIYQQDYID